MTSERNYPPFDSWRKLLGKQVVVRLADQVVTRGRLIAFDDGGEAKLVDDMGFIHYCWPMLDVMELREMTDQSPMDGAFDQRWTVAACARLAEENRLLRRQLADIENGGRRRDIPWNMP